MQPLSPRPALLRSIAATLLYAAAVVWTSIHPSGWTLAVVAAPLIAMLIGYSLSAWRKPDAAWLVRLHGFALLLVCVGTLLALQPFWLQNFKWVYLLQHCGIHLALGWHFANTLKAGREPLCTLFARLVHPQQQLSEQVVSYTRRVTLAWSVFFLAIGIGSLLVFWLLPLSVWMVFSTFVTMLLTALMFLVEALIRSHVLPATYRSRLSTTWRAVEHHFRGSQAS